MKKSWATLDQHVVDHNTAQEGSSQPPSVSQQLASVACKLEQALPDSQQKGSAEATWSYDDPKDQKVKDLQCLQQSLAALPLSPDFKEDRTRMLTRIAEKKKAITMSRPIGTRYESAKAALGRAKERLKSADEALKMAQATKTMAEKEVSEIQDDLNEMQQQLAATPSPQTSGTPEELISNLSTSLEAVFGAMQNNPTIEQDTVGHTEQQFKTLMSGVQSIFTAAQPKPAAKTEIKEQPVAASPPRKLIRVSSEPLISSPNVEMEEAISEAAGASSHGPIRRHSWKRPIGPMEPARLFQMTPDAPPWG